MIDFLLMLGGALALWGITGASLVEGTPRTTSDLVKGFRR